MSRKLIEVKNINFEYKIYNNSKNLYFLMRNVFSNSKKNNTYRVFENLNFDLFEGEFLGISGKNGSGKTTLLKLLSGIYKPTEGKINCKYSIKNPLISLHAGMLMNANAYDNILLKFLYSGYSKQDAENSMKQIIYYADLADFAEKPIRTYSTGMRFRLNFSIAVNIPQEIIILDEWLSVADQNFKDRVYGSFKSFLSNAKGLVMASNNNNTLKEKCTRIIYL